MATTRTINLTRYGPVDDIPCQHAWAMTVVAEGINMPSEIFVFQVDIAPLEGDAFRCVAAVNDLYEFPTTPDAQVEQDELQIPYYRKAKVEVVFRNPAEAEAAWAVIQRDVDDLITNFCASERLQVVGSHSATCTGPGESLIVDDQLPQASTVYQIEMAFEPIGESVEGSGGSQDQEGPFEPALLGWLPLSEIPDGFVDEIPSNAKYFYNIDADADLKALFPLKTPYDVHLVHYQGDKLPFNGPYTITKDTIYWLDFEPGAFSEYAIAGNAPWGLDYVDRANPGTEIDISIHVHVDL